MRTNGAKLEHIWRSGSVSSCLKVKVIKHDKHQFTPVTCLLIMLATSTAGNHENHNSYLNRFLKSQVQKTGCANSCSLNLTKGLEICNKICINVHMHMIKHSFTINS